MRPFDLALLYPHGWLAADETCKSTFAALRAGHWDIGLLEGAANQTGLVDRLLENTQPQLANPTTTTLWFQGRRRQLVREVLIRGAQPPCVASIDAMAEHDPWLHAELMHARAVGPAALQEAFRVGELRTSANDKGPNLNGVRKWLQDNQLNWESPLLGATVLDVFLAMAQVSGMHPGWAKVARGQSTSEKQVKIQRRKDLIYLGQEVLASHATPARLGMWWAALQSVVPLQGPNSPFLQEDLVETEVRPLMLKLIPDHQVVEVLEALATPSSSVFVDALRFPAVCVLFEKLHRFTRNGDVRSSAQHFAAPRDRMWTIALRLAAALPADATPCLTQTWAGAVGTGVAHWDADSGKGWGFDKAVWETSAAAVNVAPAKQQELLVAWLAQPGPANNRLGQLDSMMTSSPSFRAERMSFSGRLERGHGILRA